MKLAQIFISSIGAFAMSVALGPFVIHFLKERGIGKEIRPEGPSSHEVKEGTPTMGGIIFLGPVLVVTAWLNLMDGLSMLLPVGVMVLCGVLGGVDDMMGLAGAGGGMRARFKFVWLLVLAVGVALILRNVLFLESITVPFFGKFTMGFWYVPVAAFVILATCNAVNLTDGLDALAGSTVALAFVAYGVIAYMQEQSFLATFCFAVAGALLGFLWYNAHPAQVFMGDTGSLALGGALGVTAMMSGQWLLLPIIGAVFVAEATSVVLQVAYFKVTGGRRIFRMSPLHHHFELVGWSEPQVATRFFLVGTIGAMAGITLSLF